MLKSVGGILHAAKYITSKRNETMEPSSLVEAKQKKFHSVN